MPVRLELDPPPPANSTQPGVATTLLYSGAKFQGYQKSKGNSYEVEVVLQVDAQVFFAITVCAIFKTGDLLENVVAGNLVVCVCVLPARCSMTPCLVLYLVKRSCFYICESDQV